MNSNHTVTGNAKTGRVVDEGIANIVKKYSRLVGWIEKNYYQCMNNSGAVIPKDITEDMVDALLSFVSTSELNEGFAEEFISDVADNVSKLLDDKHQQVMSQLGGGDNEQTNTISTDEVFQSIKQFVTFAVTHGKRGVIVG